MPSVAPTIIVNSIIDAISQSGGAAIYVPVMGKVHPRKFFVTHNENNFTLWVYIWTLTHGGRPNLPNEYRIQMTSVSSPLSINPEGYTVLLGYYPDLNVFAGFDLQRHQIFTIGSPSIQINISAIHDALQNGLSFTTKDNLEIAVGIRPDQLLNYTYNAITFHVTGTDTRTYTLLERASRNLEIPNNELEEISAERQIIVSNVRRYSRNANFRRQVLNAYENRCAVTRAQLELVEAAHILPVPEEGSSDHITNGIALSPTMHRAFDNSLIYLDENLYIRPNEEKIEQLRSNNQIGGLTQFRSLLNRQIHLPADPNQHPNIAFINEANKLRRIPGF
jgi:putative restriction endonuclease